jgi:dCMP deaminase
MKNTQHQWDDRFLDLAAQIGGWSKDSTKIGAVIVDDNKRILSQGYNGFPRGIEDHPSRLDNREEKLKYIVHAEMNCIYNACHSGVSLNGATLYVSGLPTCSDCAKGVIQSGIKRAVMKFDFELLRGPWGKSWMTSQQMFSEANVQYEILNDTRNISRIEPGEA